MAICRRRAGSRAVRQFEGGRDVLFHQQDGNAEIADLDQSSGIYLLPSMIAQT